MWGLCEGERDAFLGGLFWSTLRFSSLLVVYTFDMVFIAKFEVLRAPMWQSVPRLYVFKILFCGLKLSFCVCCSELVTKTTKRHDIFLTWWCHWWHILSCAKEKFEKNAAKYRRRLTPLKYARKVICLKHSNGVSGVEVADRGHSKCLISETSLSIQHLYDIITFSKA